MSISVYLFDYRCGILPVLRLWKCFQMSHWPPVLRWYCTWYRHFHSKSRRSTESTSFSAQSPLWIRFVKLSWVKTRQALDFSPLKLRFSTFCWARSTQALAPWSEKRTQSVQYWHLYLFPNCKKTLWKLNTAKITQTLIRLSVIKLQYLNQTLVLNNLRLRLQKYSWNNYPNQFWKISFIGLKNNLLVLK